MTHAAAEGPADVRPAALRDGERRELLEEVFRRAPTFLHVLRGPEFVFELANPAYYQLVGHRDLIGRPAFEALPEAAGGGFPERLARVMATREPFVGRELPVTLARTPGTPPEERLIDLVYLPLVEPDGTCERVLGHGTDVTDQVRARRHSEAALDAERRRLADVVRLAPAFMGVLRGPDHVIALTNAGFDVLVGGRDVRGRPVAEALPEAAAQGFVALLDRVLATGEPFVGREVPYRRPDAAGAEDERYVDFVYQALAEADGTRSGVFVHGVDVTDQVRARREVERLLAESERARAEADAARADAERASRAKSEFLATMSHELRTPLNAIGGYAELIELGIRGPVTTEQRADLEKIQRAQRHLLGLINRVLNYARVEAGAVHYEVADVPLGEVLATCEALVAPQARAKGLALRYDVVPPSLRVRADREKLQQVVLNLLSNAVKFTEPGGRVTLACAAAGGGGDPAVRVTVRDTGIGIAPDQLARAFEPFVQVDARLTRTREGTGLGLAISRDLARGMGGDLTAESTPGVGSAFTLTLPAA